MTQIGTYVGNYKDMELKKSTLHLPPLFIKDFTQDKFLLRHQETQNGNSGVSFTTHVKPKVIHNIIIKEPFYNVNVKR